MITLKEIAKMCQVSTSTVSNILNEKPNVSEETRQKVLQVIRDTGYQPNYFAASIRKQYTKVIGIITEDLYQFSSPRIVESIMEYCESHDYKTVLINLRLYDRWKATWFDDHEKQAAIVNDALREVQSIKVDGVIYVAGHCRKIDIFPEDYSIPTVVTYAYTEDERFPSIIIDDEKGGYDVINHIVQMGHKKIGVIGGMPDNIHTKSRLKGCQKAMYENGIAYNPDWTLFGDWERPSGYECAKRLMKDGPTVIWCMNDKMAAGAYDYAREIGAVVGKDISIVGYDNMDIASYLYPPLTTNEIPLEEIGLKSAEVMIKLLDNEEVDLLKPIPMQCTLQLRQSVAQI